MNKIITDKRGLSLIEILVAFSILALVFIALSQSFPYGLSINKSAESATLASFLAQDKIEELHSLGYDGITVGEVEPRHRLSNDSGEYLYFFERQTEVASLDENLVESMSDTGMKKISTTIYYINSIFKTEEAYNITTLISRR